MNNLFVIIPLTIIDENTEGLLLKSVKTIPNDIFINIVVSSKEDSAFIEKIVEERKLNNEYRICISEIDIDKNINNKEGVLINNELSYTGHEWVTFIRLGDEFTDNWFNNIKDYIEKKPCDVFLPLTDEYFSQKGNYIFKGFINEAPLASSFSEKLGYLDLESLEYYNQYNVYGGVFSVKMLSNIGNIKTSMKASYWLELIMRILYNKYDIYVIPKVGYMRYDYTEPSMEQEEALWWNNLAKAEYTYNEDRNIQYKK